jgi:hypothetical protein
MGLTRRTFRFACVAILAFACLRVPAAGAAGAWDEAAGELAGRILARVRLRPILMVEVKNQSSLASSDVDEITQALLAWLRRRGARVLKSARPTALVSVTLSENLQSLVWVAEIRRTAQPGQPESREVVVMEVPRPQPEQAPAQPEALVIRKAPLYEQEAPILDLAILPPPAATAPMAPTPGAARLLVLDTQKVSLLAKLGTEWIVEQSAPVVRQRPWPRDPRGRIMLHQDGTLEVYTPGTACAGSLEPALSLQCREGSEAWPLGTNHSTEMRAEFSPDRNFFDGKVSFGAGEQTVPPFFSAASVAKASGVMRVFAGTDGQARVYTQGSEAVLTHDGWGSDIVALESDCSAAPLVLATRPGGPEETDSIQAYIINGNSVAEASSPVEFSGPVTALWPAADGRSAMAVAQNLKAGKYEAFTLSMACSH